MASRQYSAYISRGDDSGMLRVAARLREFLARLEEIQPKDDVPLELIRIIADQARGLIQSLDIYVPLQAAKRARSEGRSGEAQTLFERALGAARLVDGTDKAMQEAVVLGTMGRFEEAAAAYRGYLRGLQTDSAAQQILSLFERSKLGNMEKKRYLEIQWEAAGSFFKQIEYWPLAREYFQRVEQSAGKRWWVGQDRPWTTLESYGAVAEGYGELEEALALYKEGITLLEASREKLDRDQLRRVITGSARQLYSAAARVALALAAQKRLVGDEGAADRYTERSFLLSERGRARALVELMSNTGLVDQPMTARSEEVRQWRVAQAALSIWRGLVATESTRADPDSKALQHYQQKADEAESDLRAATEMLAREAPAFHVAVNPNVEPPGLEKIVSRLAPRTLLIVYEVEPDVLLSWAISQEGIVASHSQDLPQHQLQVEASNFIRSCREHKPLLGGEANLSRWLFDPFARELEQYERIIFVPSGILHDAPLHALPWKGDPLGANFATSTLPSAGAGALLSQRASLAKRVLAVGDPQGMRWPARFGREPKPAPALPWSEIEARYITRDHPQSEVLIGAAATEEAFLKYVSTARIIHLATHAHLSETTPLLSCILMADGQNITVQEMMGLQLDADLVVLSACASGRGERSHGDDLLGLSRALLAGGARAALVSLWPVSDVSTCVLMGEFYRQLHNGVASSVALQRARQYLRQLDAPTQIEVTNNMRLELEQYGQGQTAAKAKMLASRGSVRSEPTYLDTSHPYFWAPFLLVGL